MSTITIVLPVHDERPTLPTLYARLSAVLSSRPEHFELLFVDDGSTDGSGAFLRELARADARVSILTLARCFGHQAALAAGIDHAHGDAVVLMDADLQDPPEVLPDLLDRFAAGDDVVVAQRAARRGETPLRRVMSAAFYRVLRALSSTPLDVDAGDFRLLSRRALDALDRLPEQRRYLRGLTRWIGLPTSVVRYDRAPRHAGRSRYGLARSLALAADGLLGFSQWPARLPGLTGAAVTLAGALLAAHASVHLALGLPGPAASAELVAIVVLGGLQLTALGVVSLFAARIYDEVRGRPPYVVADLARGAARVYPPQLARSSSPPPQPRPAQQPPR